MRKVKDGPGDFELYGFMTTAPNALIKPIHEKAMPVILRTQEETETWLTAPWPEASAQRHGPDDALVIVEKPATQIKFPSRHRLCRAKARCSRWLAFGYCRT